MTDATIYRALRWSKRPVNSAVMFALKGPQWMPMPVRRVPLRVLSAAVEVQVLVMRKLNGVSGS